MKKLQFDNLVEFEVNHISLQVLEFINKLKIRYLKVVINNNENVQKLCSVVV
jgi:predicted HAD superfamily phosphohydrolase YqeG